MTPADRRELAELCYAVPGAALLLLEAVAVSAKDRPSAASVEDRERARRALLSLDLAVALDELPDPSTAPLDVAARAFARCLTELATTADRATRHRLAPLLGAVCREASRLQGRREAS